MKKVNVLVQDGITLNSETLCNICTIKKDFSANIEKLKTISIAVFSNESDAILLGYTLGTGIKVFILADSMEDISAAFPDVVVIGDYSKLINAVQAEIQIHYDYELCI